MQEAGARLRTGRTATARHADSSASDDKTDGPGAARGAFSYNAQMRVTLGLERLLGSGVLRGQRVGIVSNPASVDAAFRHLVDRIDEGSGATLAAIFGPQHGFRSDVQDNMIETPHVEDGRRRVPIYSLYSETREPTAEMLAGVDVLVIDLQDVGARIYTYIYTMANCLRAAKKHGVKVIVCDRPNPIGGVEVEGPMLHPGYESFVGLFPIPMRHGMTIGELARLFNEHFAIGAELEVVPMDGWTRDQYFDATGLPWVMPSPNMPTLDTAIVYPGMVLFEGTMLSEGRGTTRPFELLGAPWIHAERFAAAMNATAVARRLVQAGRLRTNVPEARQDDVRRVPDPRDRSGGVPPGSGCGRSATRVLSARSSALCMASAAVRIRARQDADRHPGGIAVAQDARRSAGATRPDFGGMGRWSSETSGRVRRIVLGLLTRGSSRHQRRSS